MYNLLIFVKFAILRTKGKRRTEADNKELEQLLKKREKDLKEREPQAKAQKAQSKMSFEERKEAKEQKRIKDGNLTTEEARKGKSERLTNLVKKFVPVINSNEGIIKKFGELSSNETKTLLRAFRNNSPIIKTLKNKLDAINVDNTTFRDLMGKDKSFKDGMLNFVPFQIAKDFKPKQGNIQELVGEERVANLLQEFSIDKNSLLDYLQDVDIDVRKQQTEGQVGGGFPQGFSVEDQVFNSLQNYINKSSLVAGTFDTMESITPGMIKQNRKRYAEDLAIALPGRQGIVKPVFEAQEALKGLRPIQKFKGGKLGGVEGQIQAGSPVVITKEGRVLKLDPDDFPPVPGKNYQLPGITVAEVKPIGSKQFVLTHQSGFGKDTNKIKPEDRKNFELRYKSQIDPLHLPYNSYKGEFYNKEQIRNIQVKGIKTPLVGASGSLSYDFRPDQKQLEQGIDVNLAQTAIAGKDPTTLAPKQVDITATQVPRGTLTGKKLESVFALSVPSVPAFPYKGKGKGKIKTAVPDEAIFTYSPSSFDPKKLRTQRTIYPTLQQNLLFKGGGIQ